MKKEARAREAEREQGHSPTRLARSLTRKMKAIANRAGRRGEKQDLKKTENHVFAGMIRSVLGGVPAKDVMAGVDEGLRNAFKAAPVTEGYEQVVLNTLEKEGIEGCWFENGTLVVPKNAASKSEVISALDSNPQVLKTPKIRQE